MVFGNMQKLFGFLAFIAVASVLLPSAFGQIGETAVQGSPATSVNQTIDEQFIDAGSFGMGISGASVFPSDTYRVSAAMPLAKPIVLSLIDSDLHDKQSNGSIAFDGWTYVAAWQVSTYWNWSIPDNWVARDFHVNFRCPKNVRHAQMVFYTRRAYDVFLRTRDIPGGVHTWFGTIYYHVDLTAGFRARAYNYYYTWDNAEAWANEMRLRYQY